MGSQRIRHNRREPHQHSHLPRQKLSLRRHLQLQTIRHSQGRRLYRGQTGRSQGRQETLRTRKGVSKTGGSSSGDCSTVPPELEAVGSARNILSRSYFFSTNYFFLLSFSRPPRGYLKTKNSFTPYERRLSCCWRREWDLNPRAPKGHRLTGEPIPDMGPRAKQTARYQAPESRPNRQPF